MMNKKLVSLLVLSISLIFPVAVLADQFTAPTGNMVITSASIVTTIINIIWPFVFVGMIIAFLYAGMLFLTAQGDATKISKARSAVIWGVAGVVVILLAFTIISMVKNEFSIF